MFRYSVYGSQNSYEDGDEGENYADSLKSLKFDGDELMRHVVQESQPRDSHLLNFACFKFDFIWGIGERLHLEETCAPHREDSDDDAGGHGLQRWRGGGALLRILHPQRGRGAILGVLGTGKDVFIKKITN